MTPCHRIGHDKYEVLQLGNNLNLEKIGFNLHCKDILVAPLRKFNRRIKIKKLLDFLLDFVQIKRIVFVFNKKNFRSSTLEKLLDY